MLFWRVPTTATSHRLGNRMGPYRVNPRAMRSVRAFHVCQLNKHHMVSIAVGLGVITLLLVIFAYHGGYGVGSWFYSLLVVLSGLAFVVFGPLLLCRFLMHAYYRQLEARSMRLRATAQTQTGDATALPPAPHVYACIIITQDEDGCSNGRGASRLAELPTYDEAVSQLVSGSSPTHSMGGNSRASTTLTTGGNGANAERDSNQSPNKEMGNHKDLHFIDGDKENDFTISSLPTLDTDDSPPSYKDALAMIRNRSITGSAIGAVDSTRAGAGRQESVKNTNRTGDGAIGGEADANGGVPDTSM